jgi:putative hydrolase of the HAD superfamily
MSFQRLPRIRGVVLDADGTLYTLRSSVGTLYSEVLSRFSISVNPRDLDGALPTVWKAFEDEYLARGDEYRTEPARERRQWNTFIERMLKESGIGNPAPAITEALYAEFARGDIRMLAAGAAEFLKTARESGIMTVVATNNDERVQSTINELGLLSHVTHIFWAGQLRWKKPSPHFFHEISRRLGIDGSQLLHVGNDLALDVRAAQYAGWEALLFDPEDRSPAPNIRSFAELGLLVRERGT